MMMIFNGYQTHEYVYSPLPINSTLMSALCTGTDAVAVMDNSNLIWSFIYA